MIIKVGKKRFKAKPYDQPYAGFTRSTGITNRGWEIYRDTYYVRVCRENAKSKLWKCDIEINGSGFIVPDDLKPFKTSREAFEEAFKILHKWRERFNKEIGK